jgi:hypothetical protein
VKTDIVVRAHDGDLKSRIAIYPGTVCYGDEKRFGQQMYREGAFLPRGETRCPFPDELTALDGHRAVVGRSRLIGIVSLSQSLLDGLRAAKVDEGKIPLSALESYPFAELTVELALGWIVRGPLKPLGYASYPAGFHTVTFDAVASRFIGLHIDDLDELPIGIREQSTTRLCINLGEHSRYLLFVNVSALGMAQMLARDDAGGSFKTMRSTPLIHAFMNAFSEYPVVRLEVRPGEAYIAPTENMIHDGSTLGMRGTDHQVTLRGIIDPL